MGRTVFVAKWARETWQQEKAAVEGLGLQVKP